MTTNEIRSKLFALRDEKYAAFQAPLIPTVNPDTFIGVRTPVLRSLAKEIVRQDWVGEFLADLPHRYFDENQLHAFIIATIGDFAAAIAAVERFLPYVDNWATCDQLLPRAFRRSHADLLPYIERWVASDHEYTVRFGLGTIMQHYLDSDFDTRYLDWACAIQRDEYYIKMMQAWLFATALAKQYDATLPYIEQHRLAPWTHNKTIQKAIESFRVPQPHKDYLRTLKLARNTIKASN
ncbi:MAG: DNA alkylation repair protein [Bacteroidales bacterium]|nr:DNA alkylation repair protein [Bacteroidales bacterium]